MCENRTSAVFNCIISPARHFPLSLLCLSLPLSLRIPAELHLPTEPPPFCTSFLLTERRIEWDSERRLDKQEESAALLSLAIFHDRGGGIEKSETERTREREGGGGGRKTTGLLYSLFLLFSLLHLFAGLAGTERGCGPLQKLEERLLWREKKDEIWLHTLSHHFLCFLWLRPCTHAFNTAYFSEELHFFLHTIISFSFIYHCFFVTFHLMPPPRGAVVATSSSQSAFVTVWECVCVSFGEGEKLCGWS